MKELFELQTGIYPRWASCENRTGQKGSAAMTGGGRKGSAYIPVQAHSTVTLACEKGTSGIVRRMWMTLSDMSQVMLRGLRLKCYWDGDLLPAVNTPLGDFSPCPQAEYIRCILHCFRVPRDAALFTSFKCLSAKACVLIWKIQQILTCVNFIMT